MMSKSKATRAVHERKPYARPAIVETRTALADIVREYKLAMEENELTLSEYENELAERIQRELIDGGEL
jgi:hypothetical protein